MLTFTPQGQVIMLLPNSNVLDFAFAIHSDLGIRAVAAKVNGKEVGLDHILSTQDTVEIICDETNVPKLNYLSMIKNPETRYNLRKWFSKHPDEVVLERAREEFRTEIQEKLYLDVDDIMGNNDFEERLDQIFRSKIKKDVLGINEKYLEIGKGNILISHIIRAFNNWHKEKYSGTVAKSSIPAGQFNNIKHLFIVHKDSEDMVFEKGIREKSIITANIEQRLKNLILNAYRHKDPDLLYLSGKTAAPISIARKIQELKLDINTYTYKPPKRRLIKRKGDDQSRASDFDIVIEVRSDYEKKKVINALNALEDDKGNKVIKPKTLTFRYKSKKSIVIGPELPFDDER